MLSIILHDTCIHHSNVCDIEKKSSILLFNSYMQCHYIAFVLVLLEDYTSSYIFKGYILHWILILDTRVMSLVKKPFTLYCERFRGRVNIYNSKISVHSH